MTQILAIDIGAGTQDILLYDSKKTLENCVKLVLPSPTVYFGTQIEKANNNIFIDGDTIGGGSCVKHILNHIKKGYSVFMTPDAARTVRDNPKQAEAKGIKIVNSCPDNFSGKQITFSEFTLHHILESLKEIIDSFYPDAIVIAVQDHGHPPEGVSDREFRFNLFRKQLQAKNQLHQLCFEKNTIPPAFHRWNTVVAAAQKAYPETPILIADTAIAAVRGCLWEKEDRNSLSVLINCGNEHTFFVIFGKNKLFSLCEHHTSFIANKEIDTYLSAFLDQTLTHEQIFLEDGHGVLNLHPFVQEDIKTIYCTGPNRALFSKNSFDIEFPAPGGDMMLTGPLGLVLLGKDKGIF